MNHLFTRVFILLLYGNMLSVSSIAQYTHTWTGAASADWNNPQNWNPQTVPGPTSWAYVNLGDQNIGPELTADVVTGGLTMRNCYLGLHGHNLKATGTDLEGVYINSYGSTLESAWQRMAYNTTEGDFTLYYNAPAASGYQANNYNYYGGTFTYRVNIGTAFVTMYANTWDACRFEIESGSVHIGYYADEQVTFWGPVEIHTSQQGYLSFATQGEVVFKQPVTITHHTPQDPQAYVRFSSGAGSLTRFEKALTIKHGQGKVHLGEDGNCEFRGTVTLSSIHTTQEGIAIGQPTGTGSHRFTETARLQTQSGNTAYAHPSLSISHTTFENPAQQWTLGGNCALHLTGCRFVSAVQVSSPHFYLKNNVFEVESSFTKLSEGENASEGGNTFYGKLTLRNTQPTGKIRMATQANDIILY